ncbi:MAG: hypothetical protein Q8P41_19920 [Pseudomonadota bacterium]|nr:hypothetical protein [Pseudomonadota bacterium]
MLTPFLLSTALAAEPAAAAAEPLGFWIGATPPSIGFGVGSFLAAGGDVDVRIPFPLKWLQPQVNLTFANGVGAYYFLPYLTDDRALSLTVNARFGLDHGFYGGLGGGVAVWHVEDGSSPATRVLPNFHAFGGYAFRAGDHARISPELTLGTLSTVVMRFEWGG